MVDVEDFDDETAVVGSRESLRAAFAAFPSLGHVLDTGNYYFWKDDVLSAQKEFASRIRHVHVKDRDPKEPKISVASGTGLIPVKEVVRRLSKDGYRGFVTIECYSSTNLWDDIRRSAEFLREIVESPRMRYLYSDGEAIVSPYPCEVVAHPYVSDGHRVASAKAGEAFGPLAPGSYLIREEVAPERIRTRYLAVAAKGWTVVQLTCGTTGDKLDSVVHARRIPMNYYVGIDEAQKDTTFLGWQRDYGDEILLHLHPDSLGLKPTDRLRIRLSTVAGADEPLSYLVKVKSGWKKIFGFNEDGQSPVIWDCPKVRSKDGLFTFDVAYGDLTDGILSIQLRTNQKQILDDWFSDGGFIARLERILVTVCQ